MRSSGRVGPAARGVFALARLAGNASRVAGVGRGGTVPGRVALAMRPAALSELTAGRTVVLVSGTNGKSTTTRLLVAALSWRGTVVTNGDGANLLPGLVAALLQSVDKPGDVVLEVDERVLPLAIDACRPTAVVLLNLSRDQLDRFEEVGSHVARWAAALRAHPGMSVVANAADPLVVAAVSQAGHDRVTWVDVGSPWRADAPLCPTCGNAWDLTRTPWSCDACGAQQPTPQWRLEGSAVVDPEGVALPLQLSIPGRAGAANAVMAVAAAHLLGVPAEAGVAQLAAVRQVDGRYLTALVDGREVQLLLAKNPAGWLEVLDEVGRKDSALILGINARSADGTDPSWLWDVPFERLRGRHVIAFGDRSLDLSVRLHYAGVEHAVAADVADAVARAPVGAVSLAANYTAFVTAREALHVAAV